MVFFQDRCIISCNRCFTLNAFALVLNSFHIILLDIFSIVESINDQNSSKTKKLKQDSKQEYAYYCPEIIRHFQYEYYPEIIWQYTTLIS